MQSSAVTETLLGGLTITSCYREFSVVRICQKLLQLLECGQSYCNSQSGVLSFLMDRPLI